MRVADGGWEALWGVQGTLLLSLLCMCTVHWAQTTHLSAAPSPYLSSCHDSGDSDRLQAVLHSLLSTFTGTVLRSLLLTHVCAG